MEPLGQPALLTSWRRGVGPLGTVRDYAIGAVGVCADLHTFVTDFRISGGFSKLTVVRFHARHDLTVICQFVGLGHA